MRTTMFFISIITFCFLLSPFAFGYGNLQFKDDHNNTVNSLWDERSYHSSLFPNGIPWKLNNKGTNGALSISTGQLQVIVNNAFETWEAVPESKIAFTFAGMTPNGTPGNSDSGVPPDPEALDGDNLIVFGDAPYGALAITSIFTLSDEFTFNDHDADPNNDTDFGAGDGIPHILEGTYPAGTILDADILVSKDSTTWSVTGERHKIDLQGVLVHEIGHFIGLCHSCVRETYRSEATMFPFVAYNPEGLEQKSLAQDDIAGVSSYYPSSSFATSFGSISGSVTKGGTPFTLGAHVWAVKNDNRDVIVGCYSDESGNYSLKGLLPGNYILRVEPICVDDDRINEIIAIAYYPDNIDFQAQIYNGVSIESSATLINVTTGATITGKNFILVDGSTTDPFEPDDTPVQAHLLIPNGSREIHHFYPIGDVDYFRFSASSGTTYRIRTSNIQIEKIYLGYNINADTLITLFNSDTDTMLSRNNNMSYSNSRLESYILFRCTRTDQYFIKIEDDSQNPVSYNPGAGSNYDIQIDIVNPTEYYVSSSTGSDATGNGSKTSPWSTVHHAIDVATGSLDTPVFINAFAGTYYEHLTCDNFESLFGGFDPITWTRNTALYISILDGMTTGTIITLADAMSVEGFTIRNGYSQAGGGCYAAEVDGQVVGNIFENNIAGSGGAICVCDYADCFISSNTFSSNSAGFGGAIAYPDASPFIYNNQFINNMAGSAGGAIASSNVLYYLYGSIINNLFLRNRANSGGTIYLGDGRVDTIDKNMFAADSATNGGAILITRYTAADVINNVFTSCYAASGGAIWISWRGPTFCNNIFAGNSATNSGGAIYSYTPLNDEPDFYNNVFVGNKSSLGGAINWGFSFGKLANNTFWENDASTSGGAIYIANSGMAYGYDVYFENNIFSRNYGGAVYEEGTASDLSVRNNNFANNYPAAYFDHDTFSWYDTASSINTNVINPGAVVSGNVDWAPGFKPAPSGIAGKISYNTATYQSILIDNDASFTPNALARLTINPNTTQHLHFYIISNTATTLTVWGNMTVVATPPCTYQVFDYHLANTSQNIDAGLDVSSSVTTDIDGQRRPLGKGFDIGADEYYGTTAPVADFYGTPTSGVSPLTVQFYDTSYDYCGSTITSWNWSFGDGLTSTTRNPVHTYPVLGISTTYTVQLIIRNAYGISTLTKLQYISVQPPSEIIGLSFSTFLGGSSGDDAKGIIVDTAGNSYIIGNTQSTNFPTTIGAYDTTSNGSWDVFVTKLNPTGSALVYSTFIGGSNTDSGDGIALDGNGNVYLTGYTSSTNFPTTAGATSTSYNGGVADVFVTKLNPTGTALVYSTYLGGSGEDRGCGITIDSAGNAYITGYTASSTNFPTTLTSFDTTYNGGSYDCFISKLNTSGTALVYSTLIGGNNSDYGQGITIDSGGNAYITGYTASTNFPTTSGALDTTNTGSNDVFVSKLNPTGAALVYSTYLGGSDQDYGKSIAIDNIGNAYITGNTWGTNFPKTSGAFDSTANGYTDAFVTKLNTTGSELLYSTLLGGNNYDYGNSIAVDSLGNAYITGYTSSSNFPTTPGTIDTSYNGSQDVFVAKLKEAGSRVIFCTLLGGSSDDRGQGIAIDSTGSAYITGLTYSSNFPTTSGAFDTSFNGGSYDAFVSKIAMHAPPGADFYGTPTTGMVPVSVQFYDTSYGIPTSWNWSFGNGSTSTQQNPVHIYTTVSAPTSYKVTLIARNIYGTSTMAKTNYISVVPTNKPNTGFYGTPTSGRSPLTVNFVDTTGNYPTSWNWSFGDSGISTTQSPSHVYATVSVPTSYTVQLIASNAYGSSTLTKQNYISLLPPIPQAGFYGTPTSGYAPLTVNFVDTSANNPTSWTWSFGDGTTSSIQNPTHIYNTAGTYNVRLIVSNAYGISTATKNNYIKVSTPTSLFANFYGTPTSGTTPLSVQFYDTSTDSPGPSSWFWSFGDGNSSSVKNPEHTYAPVTAPTAYTVQLIVSNANSTNTITRTNYIYAIPPEPIVLNYSTFIGGNSGDYGYRIAVDSAGNTYITGATFSTNFPTTVGSYDTTYNDSGIYGDVFVSKLNSTGTTLLYSTFLGGNDQDYGSGIAVDSIGNAFITGYTYSSNFPITSNSFDTSFNSVDWSPDAFVCKLNSSGSVLLYSTFIGGSNSDYGNDIAIDGSENAYVTGVTISDNFPTTNGAFDTTLNIFAGYPDAFVCKLNASGSALIYSTFLGGNFSDIGQGIAVDTTGDAYITGYTYSSNFPTTPGAFDTTQNGNGDGFVIKLNPLGSALVYSTFLGGNGYDYCKSIAVDNAGNAYITGYTASTNFPTTPGSFGTKFNGSNDVFISKLNPSGSALVYSGLFGGEEADYGNSIAIDSTGNAYITGYTSSNDFPTTIGAPDRTFNGNTDVFVCKINPTGSAILSSTYLGGIGEDCGNSIAIDAIGNICITGYTSSSTDFPTTVGAFDTTFNGGSYDVFVSKFSQTAIGKPRADFYGSPGIIPRPYGVSFYDISYSIPTSWYWTFGDGSSSNLKNPTHTYANVGIYPVTLVANNAFGASTITKNNYILVFDTTQKQTINAPGTTTFYLGTWSGSTEYTPITMTIATVLHMDTVTITVFDTKHPNAPTNYFLSRWYRITHTGGITNFGLTLGYTDADFADAQFGPLPEEQIELARFSSSSTWNWYPYGTLTHDTFWNTVAATGLTAFSDWTLSAPAGIPVELSQFEIRLRE